MWRDSSVFLIVSNTKEPVSSITLLHNVHGQHFKATSWHRRVRYIVLYPEIPSNHKLSSPKIRPLFGTWNGLFSPLPLCWKWNTRVPQKNRESYATFFECQWKRTRKMFPFSRREEINETSLLARHAWYAPTKHISCFFLTQLLLPHSGVEKMCHERKAWGYTKPNICLHNHVTKMWG